MWKSMVGLSSRFASEGARGAMRVVRHFVVVGAALLSWGCRDPVAPMVPNCNDDFHPAMCMDGDEVCETDDQGCRQCVCERDDEEASKPK